MFKIGLTGGICTGKTFVIELLKELGCYTAKADEIAKKIIFSSKSDVLEPIINVFGPSVYDEKLGLNKEIFTRMMYEDDDKRTFVNNMVHPLVKAERLTIIKSLEESEVYNFFVYESALLVESGTYKDFDKIIVVYTTPEEQLQRLMTRDTLSREAADKRIKSQFPLSEKLKVANYTIDTTGSFEYAKTKTLETFHLLKKDVKLA